MPAVRILGVVHGAFTFLWIGCRNLWRYERLRSVHDAFLVKSLYCSCGEAQHRRKDVRGIVADRRRAAPDAPRCQRHLRHDAEDSDRHARLSIEHWDSHITSRLVLVVVLVAHVEHASATYLHRVQCGFNLNRRVCSTVVAQASVELAPLLVVHRRGVLRALVVAVFDWVKTEESRHPVVDRAAERTDKDPAAAAFERVVGLKARRPVAGMAGDRASPVKIGSVLPLVWATASNCARSITWPRPVFFTSHSAIIVAAQPVSAVT